MAKCVVCTTLNAHAEAKRHPNFHNQNLAELLAKRYDDTPKSERNRYCALHSTTGTGRATEKNAIRIIAEREAEEKAAQN